MTTFAPRNSSKFIFDKACWNKACSKASSFPNTTRFAKACNFNLTCSELSKIRSKSDNYSNIDVIKDLNIKKKFDVIYSEQTLEHLENPLATINTFTRLLKKTGIMILKFPTSINFKSKLKKNYIPLKDCAHPLEHINIITYKIFVTHIKILFRYPMKLYCSRTSCGVHCASA